MTDIWSALVRRPATWFRSPKAIAGRAEVEDFLDRHAAFMVQKCIFEYSRARSGVLSARLFKEAAFKAAVEAARWRNYPLCLQHVALMVEHTLRPAAGEAAPDMREGLISAVAAVCRRYPPPPGLPQDFWARAEERIAQRIGQAGLSPPRPVKDIPRETAKEFFEGLPIHPDLTSYDFELVTNNVRGNLIRAYEDFVAAADIRRLTDALVAEAAAARQSG